MNKDSKYEKLMHLSYIYFYADVLNRKLASPYSCPEHFRFSTSMTGSDLRRNHLIPLLNRLRRDVCVERKIPSNEYYKYTMPALNEFSTIYRCLFKAEPTTTIEKTTQRDAILFSVNNLKKITKNAFESQFNYVDMSGDRLNYFLWHITEVLKSDPENLILNASLRKLLADISAILKIIGVSPVNPFEIILSIDDNPIATLNTLKEAVKPAEVWTHYYNNDLSFEENMKKRVEFKNEFKTKIKTIYAELETRKVIIPIEI